MGITCLGTEKTFWLGIQAGNCFTVSTAIRRINASKPGAGRFYSYSGCGTWEFDLHTPTTYGDLPLLHDDPATPNENYFRHVDYIIDKAAEEGLVMGLLPTWGDKVTKIWGVARLFSLLKMH
jgi:hypothetical protein